MHPDGHARLLGPRQPGADSSAEGEARSEFDAAQLVPGGEGRERWKGVGCGGVSSRRVAGYQHGGVCLSRWLKRAWHQDGQGGWHGGCTVGSHLVRRASSGCGDAVPRTSASICSRLAAAMASPTRKTFTSGGTRRMGTTAALGIARLSLRRGVMRRGLKRRSKSNACAGGRGDGAGRIRRGGAAWCGWSAAAMEYSRSASAAWCECYAVVALEHRVVCSHCCCRYDHSYRHC